MSYLTVTEAAAEARRHPVTIRVALREKELHGSQRKAGGTWTIKDSCLAAWVEGRPCEHQASNVTPIQNRSRSA
jgi:hypothetical protein